MKRFLLAGTAAAGLLGALVAAPASAQVIELGQTTTQLVAPACPVGATGNACKIVLTQSTAVETLRDGVAYPTKVKKAGVIVAFTLGVSKIDNNRATVLADLKSLDRSYGGVPQAMITVLRPVGKKSAFQWQATQESSPTVHLIPYLGQVVQFPLVKPLPVVPGEVVALTIPTWAPVLSINLPTKPFAYRQSRSANCVNPAATQQAQLLIGSTQTYGCDYPATRVEYSVTEITNPVQTKNFVHSPDVGLGHW